MQGLSNRGLMQSTATQRNRKVANNSGGAKAKIVVIDWKKAVARKKEKAFVGVVFLRRLAGKEFFHAFGSSKIGVTQEIGDTQD